MSYTILRTPSIYGANADGIILSLLKEIAKEIKIPYVNENNIRNLIYVRNLTASIRFLMLNNKSENKVFMVKDAESFRLNEIIYRLAELMDKKVRLVKVPLKGLKLASYMNLSSHSWIQNQMEIDDNDILKTGFKAPYPTFIGFSEMIEWFLVNHKQEKKRRFFIG
ncbi:MAG: hypothetical protein BWY78_00700 [Alphaproteobacteria bacterium ADurb.Bin438]|nr:MAG: hypothetical protein BWY78_00700 [Alphaproteobacteria bacterium ADurb.Bin438]